MASIDYYLCCLDEGDGPMSPSVPGDLERAGRFHFEQDRQRWLTSRLWLRAVLGARLGCSGDVLTFTLGLHGKPALPGTRCHFNLSHSQGWAALACCGSHEVGLDLEVIQWDFPSQEVAPSVFTDRELAAWQQAAAAFRKDPTANPHPQRLFYQLWTAKEALMKATGLGMGLEPQTIEVSITDGVITGYASHPHYALWQGEASASALIAIAAEDESLSVALRERPVLGGI